MTNRPPGLLLVLFSGIIFLPTQGCKKYEEGPGISFRSRAERVANVWKVDSCKINYVDVTSLYSDYRQTFTKEGGYSCAWGNGNGYGTWTFQNKAKEIRITGTRNQESHALVIIRLEEKKLRYYYYKGDDKIVFHMVSAN